jgi:hypothetical protein
MQARTEPGASLKINAITTRLGNAVVRNLAPHLIVKRTFSEVGADPERLITKPED